MPFSSSLLISLCCESINRASYIRTNISVGGGSFTGASMEVKWLSVIGFFLGRPWPRFIGGGIVSSAGLVGSRVSSKVGGGVSSPSGLFILSSRVVLEVLD
jgi:hypothetical protein